MAKKEFRRAVRDGQAVKDRKPAGPTIKSAMLKGLLLSGIYLLLVRVLLKTSGRLFLTDLIWAALFFFMYTAFIYLWDRWLYRRRQRKLQAGAARPPATVAPAKAARATVVPVAAAAPARSAGAKPDNGPGPRDGWVGKTCPYCQSPLKLGVEVCECDTCGIHHHQQCWQQNGGCTTFGCTGGH